MYIGSNICYNSASFDSCICQSEVRLFKKKNNHPSTNKRETNKQTNKTKTPHLTVKHTFLRI